MSIPKRITLFSTLVLFLSLSVVAQSGPQTQVSLIRSQSAAKPGSEVWIGIHFQLEPGWHIYWVNPGDSGEPAKVQWSLSPGWTAGPIEWPAPHRMTNPAGVDYGYDGQPTLLTRVKIGSQTKLGSINYLVANLRWLVCKEMCVSQKGTAKTTIQVATTAAPDENGKPIVDAARAQLPKPLPAEWKTNVMKNPSQWLLNFRPGFKVNDAAFYPLEPQVIENAAPQKLSSTSMRAQLALKKDTGGNAPDRLKGVLVVNGTDAYNIDLPLKK